MSQPVLFAPFSSTVDAAFWHALSNQKIDLDGLNDSAREVVGQYKQGMGGGSCWLELGPNALRIDEETSGGYCRAKGTIKNCNTIEDFKRLDKNAFLTSSAESLWSAINSSGPLTDPSILAAFSLLCYADLKKYIFTYWFCFPVLHTEPTWLREEKVDTFSADEASFLREVVETWMDGLEPCQKGFWLMKMADYGGAPRWEIGKLEEWETFYKDTPEEERIVAFVDPSTQPLTPAWPARNLLIAVLAKYNVTRIKLLAYREQPGSSSGQSPTFVLDVSTTATRPPALPKHSGWERDTQNKLRPRRVDLGPMMDPHALASTAVDLNLKLMRWRIAPSLDLPTISATRCLLLGAGTLGCGVARTLLGWGVRKVTFVDSGRVSWSNPVRQSLFGFEDCKGGGRPKAERAAEAMNEIYPGVEATGLTLGVPMPGHPPTDVEKTRADWETLQRLFSEHDAIFLLMDSRESRWLPTLMGAAMNKIVINAALGFDSYVVMRHGEGVPAQIDTSVVEDSVAEEVEASATVPEGERLGCYFCNDVVAPVDSLSDRTLDQMCTVTRPGLASIASALAVELLVSITQHPQRTSAPAPPTASSMASRGSSVPSSTEGDPHPLGLIPHQVRGFLNNWTQLLIQGSAYDCCSACSPKIVNMYRDMGWEFVENALREPGWVEEVSGLKEVQRKAMQAMETMEWSEEEDEGEDEEGDGELV
ncbi:Autophagy protein 7 [Saitoella coloradoensis]